MNLIRVLSATDERAPTANASAVTLLFILIVLLLLILNRLPTFWIPLFNIDEAIHIVCGWLWSEGETPYIDFADHKPPLAWLFFGVCVRIFGMNLYVIHVAALLIVAVTIYIIYRAVVLVEPRAGYWAAILYAALEAAYLWQDTLATNMELLFNLPTSAALFCCLAAQKADRRIGIIAWNWLCGFFIGCAFWIKPQAGIVLPVTILFIAFANRFGWSGIKQPWQKTLVGGLTIVSGFFAFSLLVMGWASVAGILPELLRFTILDNIRYARHGPTGYHYEWRLICLPTWIGSSTLVAWFGLGVLIWKLIRQAHTPRQSWLFVLMTVACVLPVSIGGRFYGHYFIQFFPGLFASAGIGLQLFFSGIRRPRLAQRLTLVVLLWLLGVMIFMQVYGRLTWQKQTTEAAKGHWREIGHYVNQHTRLSDRIFVWGFSTPIYYWAYRKPATRYIFISSQISGYIPGHRGLLSTGMRPDASDLIRSEDRDYLLRQLRENHPEMIIDTSPAGIYDYQYYPLSVFPELKDYVDQYYHETARVAGATIYRRAN